MATRIISTQDKQVSGAGDDVQIKAGNANTSGAGGSIVIQPGAQATTGGHGVVVVRQPGGVAGTDEIQLSHDGSKGSVINKDGTLQLGGANIAIRNTANNNKTTVTAGTLYADALYSNNSMNADGVCNDSYSWGIDGSSLNWNQGFHIRVSWSHIKGYPIAGIAYTGDNTNGRYSTLEITDGGSNGGSLAYRSTDHSITANTNDLTPVRYSAFQRWSSTGNFNVTGLAPGASTSPSGGTPTWVHTNGRVIWVYNVGSNRITLKHEDAGSTAANRFLTETGGDIVVGPGRYVQLIYDTTSSRWRVTGENFPYIFPTADGTSGQVLSTNGSGTLSWANASTATGTVTSVSGTGTVNGITLTGTVTSSGNLTLGGSISNVSLVTQVTGTLPVGNGGTGATTLTGYVYGNGTSAMTASTTIPGSAISGNISGNAANVTGTVAIVNGGTGQTTAGAAFNALSPLTTLGDILYASAANTSTRLAGNTTTTKQFLSQTGTGTVSAAPAWSTVTKSDVGLANVENTALSTWAGSTNITTLGTVGTGTWNATTIGTAKGGTGLTSIGTANQVLGVNSGATGLEYKTLTAGTSISITHGANSVTIATTGLVIGTNIQAWDADLDAIAALAGTSGFLKKTAANTWTLDTSTYLTGNQTITLSGDVSGSGTTSIAVTLATVPVSKGGTGATTLTGYLYGNGTAAVTASTTIPGSAISGNISGNAANVTGTVALANGGTGATTQAGAANAILPSQATNSGKYLTTDGTNVSWGTVSGGASASGTTNYVAKFTGASALGNSLIFDNGTNVGIGATSPVAKLQLGTGTDVMANAGGLTVVGGGLVLDGAGTYADRELYFRYTSTVATISSDQALRFRTSNGAAPAERMRIDASGNVGIGTTSPSDKLHVSGNIRSGNFTYGYLAMTGDLPGYSNGLYPTLKSDNTIYFSADGKYTAYMGDASKNAFGLIHPTTGTNTILFLPNGVSFFNGGAVAFGATTAAGGGQVYIAPQASGTKGLVVRGVASQSANLTEWQTSAGQVNAYFASDGKLYVLQNTQTQQGGVEESVASFGHKSFWSNADAGLISVGFTDIAGTYNSTSNKWDMYFKTGNSGDPSARTERMRISGSTGFVGIGNNNPAGQLHVTTTVNTNKGLVVRGAASQSANLQEWQNSSGTALAAVDANGNISGSTTYGGSLLTDYWRVKSFYRAAPTTVGNYIEVCSIQEGTGYYEVSVSSEYGAGIGATTKTYNFCMSYDTFSGFGWYGGGTLTPTNMTRQNSYTTSFDFEMELHKVTAYDIRLRLRRTAGTSARYVTITVRQQFLNNSDIASLSGTGISSYGGFGQAFYIAPVNYALPVPGGSGAGNNIGFYAGNGETSGAGGSIILQPGLQATTGGNGVVVVRAAGGTAGTDELQIYHDGTNGQIINKDTGGDLKVQLGDSRYFTVARTSNNAYYVSIDPATGISCGNHGFGVTTQNNLDLYAQNSYSIRTRSNIIISDPSWNIDVGINRGGKGVLRITDSSTGGGSIAFTSNTTNISTATNDLALGSSSFQRLNCTTACNLTGVAPPTGGAHVDGRMMRIYNVGTANLTLKHNSTSSAIANRFCCVQAVDIVLAPRDYAELIYDGTDGGLVGGQNNPCWRVH